MSVLLSEVKYIIYILDCEDIYDIVKLREYNEKNTPRVLFKLKFRTLQWKSNNYRFFKNWKLLVSW